MDKPEAVASAVEVDSDEVEGICEAGVERAKRESRRRTAELTEDSSPFFIKAVR